MSLLKQSLRRIPVWAYLLVAFSLIVTVIYLVYRYQAPFSGELGKPVNGHWIIYFNTPGGPVDRAGIKIGDTLVTCNEIPVEEWVTSYHGTKAGDTLIFGVLKKNSEVGVQVFIDSKMSVYPGFFWSVSILAILISILSLFFLVRKPNDLSIFLFFVYIQLFALTSGTANVMFREPIFVFANLSYILGSCLMGPVLVHFHFLFPRPVLNIFQKKILPGSFYLFGVIIFIYSTASYYSYFNPFSGTRWQYNLLDRLVFFWIILCFIVAMGIVIIKYLKEKSTLMRNQILIIFLGSFFGLLTPMVYGIFYDFFNDMWLERPYLKSIFIGTGNLFMICCILIAIFRYRIWDIEVFIRKALLYLGATTVIILSYLFLIWFVDRFISSETNLTRFVILAVSVILFLVLRDRIQRLIDRLFHRETYDSATVVSDFEAKLAGIHQLDELKEKIFRGMDDIFHFSFFTFHLKKENLVYEPAYIYGIDQPGNQSEFTITPEMEDKLRKSKVFSPEEVNNKPPVLERIRGDLIVPIISNDQPAGFFICGRKRSERIYSRQDITVLIHLARRVMALLHTASLYQKDLDRQLMLERERARISQDMHDDVGASLTRISMMSDLVKNSPDVGNNARQWLGQISDTSRGLMEEMNQIIWALNPRNDNLEGLIAYVRRFAFEYLEPTPVTCHFDLPEKIPEMALSVEVRRNVYLVAREAIHNVVKHASATKIRINLEMNRPGFRIRIMDDGKGFDPGKLEFPGNGLINMKKRMNDIGGELRINSKIGDVTEIDLIVT